VLARESTAHAPADDHRARLTRLPVGRLVGLGLASSGMAIQAVMLVRGVQASSGTASGLVHLLATVLSLLVYLLMVSAYLLRRERAASDSSLLARLVAVAVTFLPFAMPLWSGRQLSVATDLAASVVLAVGLTGCVWSLRHLWTSFSVIPQARALVSTGPYRWVRHPLYTTEIIASLGLAVHFGRPYHWAVLMLLVVGQSYRARREERLLCLHIPGYTEYQARTAALVPGLR
jgi:protein-S-isoprenylcysteine O-methyltransferase Ste14